MSADEEAGDAGVGDDEPDWDEACRREEAIRDLLRRHPQRLSHAAVDEVAGQLGLSRASLYGAEEAMGRPAKGWHHRRRMQRMDTPHDPS